MSDTNPDQPAAKVEAELCEAIHRRHEAMEDSLARLIRRGSPRRQRRRKAIRTTALGLAAVLVLSGTALAAGEALGVIELGGEVTAVQVSSIPVWNGTTGTFITGKSEDGSYIYHLTGGRDISMSCGATDPDPTNNIYVTSTRPLASAELKEILDSELSHETKPEAAIMKEMRERIEGKRPLPYGEKWLSKGRHPMIGGGHEPPGLHKPFPPGVTSVSNGCPTPGVAGQPGTPGSSPAPGKAGVAVEPSGANATR